VNKRAALTAPCGLDCFNCEFYEENLTHNLLELVHSKMGVPKEAIACRGCREQDGEHFHLPEDGCATLNCVKSRGVDMCSYCAGFPCAFLAPVAEGASRYPHNLKMYNLCRIKKVGIQRWVEEEAGSIRKKYFTGRFAVGRGQAD